MIEATFDFHAPDLPAPRVRVRDLRPAAKDGREWRSSMLTVARALAAERDGTLTASALRLRASTLGMKPPHPNHWGSLWACLEAAGWERLPESVVSTTPTRNACRESVWRAPGAEVRS